MSGLDVALERLSRWSPAKLVGRRDAFSVFAEIGVGDITTEGALHLHGVSIPEVSLRRVRFERFAFDECRFPTTGDGFALEDCDLRDTSFSGCRGVLTLRSARANDIHVTNSNFSGSALHAFTVVGGVFERVSLATLGFANSCTFVNCSFSDVTFEGSGLDACRFENSRFVGPVDFEEARRCIFVRCDFRAAELHNPSFLGTTFDGCTWPDDDRHVTVDMERANLSAVEAALKNRHQAGPLDLVPLQWLRQFNGRQNVVPINLADPAFEKANRDVLAEMHALLRDSKMRGVVTGRE